MTGTHDPLSLGDPSLSISARGDLNPNKNKRNLGGDIDSKMTSARLLEQNIVYGRVGLTQSQQLVFYWSNFPNSTVSHDGDILRASTIPFLLLKYIHIEVTLSLYGKSIL